MATFDAEQFVNSVNQDEAARTARLTEQFIASVLLQEASRSPRGSEQFATIGTSLTTTYKLRARDSSCALNNPNKYVEWTTTTTPLTVASYPGALPCGGPLVELTILSKITR